MTSSPLRFLGRSFSQPVETDISRMDLWRNAAETDDKLCRLFERHFQARLRRSLRCQRVSWETPNGLAYGMVMPDPFPIQQSAGIWYVFDIDKGEIMRYDRTERERIKMLVLAECVEDWAELMRQAYGAPIFDVRFDIVPQFIDALGDTEPLASGYIFSLSLDAPQAVISHVPTITGFGVTPEEAAREACRHWLQGQFPDVLL